MVPMDVVFVCRDELIARAKLTHIPQQGNCLIFPSARRGNQKFKWEICDVIHVIGRVKGVPSHQVLIKLDAETELDDYDGDDLAFLK